MAVFRVQKTQNYTIMSNHHLRNKALSLKAKGLLSLMLSLPEDWDYTTRGLASICKEGVDSVCATVRELEAAGYIIRRRIRDKNGQMRGMEYTVLEQPQPPEQDKPSCAQPKQAKPKREKPVQANVGCLPGVFRYPNPQNRIHVTEKPLQLMRDVVQICEPGGRILDPFAGAGTTVLAAVQEGYEAVGIEMSDAYFRRSTERLKTALESEVNQN